MRKDTMRMWTVGTVLAAMGAAGAALLPGPIGAEPLSATARAVQEEPEEEAYRAARRAINRGEFERAVDLFTELRERHPDGRYTPESYYWQAFSLYRLEGLREALRLLEEQLAEYPEARVTRDARDLELRIRSRLGERGDPRSAQLALRQAEAALAGSSAGVEAAMERARYSSEVVAAQSAAVAQMVVPRAAMAAEVAMAGIRARTFDADRQEACEEEDVRHAALQALMQIETDRALPILRRVLARRDECSAPLRKQAIFVLSQHGEEAEELIIQAALEDPDAEVQEAAVFWLSQVGSERAFEALTDLLETAADPGLQENAIFALSQHGGERAGGVLRSYALDATKPDRLREKAIFWLSQFEAADADFLIELYGQLDSEELKRNVFFALSQADDPRAVDWMLDRALDTGESVELRKQALFWAGQHRSVDISRLSGLYGRLADREMKEQLIFLYSQRSEPEAVEEMIGIARNETDPELRKQAIFWLGQTGDERAIDFLLELVDDPDPF